MRCPTCGRKVESPTSHYICTNCGCDFGIYRDALPKNIWKSNIKENDEE